MAGTLVAALGVASVMAPKIVDSPLSPHATRPGN
jgi:hypothetical protein